MRVADIRRWQWLVIAVVVGLAYGWLREAADAEAQGPLDDYDVLLTNPRVFERALLGTADGRRLFQDIVVYPYRLSGGRPAHLVTGRYWNGRPEIADGRPVARYRPACFVAPAPYRSPAVPRSEGDAAAVMFPTVLAYLDALPPGARPPYRYAWWAPLTGTMCRSVAASLLLIGVAWPTLVNLLTFGTLTRPRQARGVSLWRVRRPAVPAPAAAPPATAQSIDDELGAVLTDASPPAGEETAEPGAVAVLPLSTAPPDPVIPPAPAGPAKAFGCEREDYYPTELHATGPTGPRLHVDSRTERGGRSEG